MAAEIRVPLPFDDDAEIAVLSCLLLPTPRGARDSQGLRAEDFYRPAHQAIFRAVQDLAVTSMAVDPVTVSDRLKGLGKLEEAGGRAFIHGLVDAMYSPVALPEHAAIVRRLSCRREEVRIARDLEAGEISREEARAALGVLIAAAETPDRADEAPTVFYPAPELRDYVSPHIDYIVDRLLARALLTIFGGKPKAGKTTFTFGIVYAVLMGLPFMGFETHKARVLYITEQNKTTIRPKLYEYGLLDSPDLHIMFPRQMLGLAWEDIITQAGTYCEDHSIHVVIVDTVNDLCHLENTFSDTEWLAALEPLQQLAQHSGLAVLAVLHAKKEAASLVDMFRGSNAIVGKADIVLGLWRDGTTRTVEGMSRLDNGFDERTRIVREGREYMTSGTVKEMELEARLREYLDVLPTNKDAAMTRQEIADALDVAPGSVTTHMAKLAAAGKVLCGTRSGKGGAKLYWAAGGDA